MVKEREATVTAAVAVDEGSRPFEWPKPIAQNEKPFPVDGLEGFEFFARILHYPAPEGVTPADLASPARYDKNWTERLQIGDLIVFTGYGGAFWALARVANAEPSAGLTPVVRVLLVDEGESVWIDRDFGQLGHKIRRNPQTKRYAVWKLDGEKAECMTQEWDRWEDARQEFEQRKAAHAGPRPVRYYDQ